METLEYPWPRISALADGSGRFPLFGYGSLISKKSAAKSLRNPDPVEAAVAYGLRRVFDYEMPTSVLEAWGENEKSKYRAALNVHRTGCSDDVINGVIVRVSLEDISELLVRERGYDLVRVDVAGWKAAPLSVDSAYTFCAPRWNGPPIFPQFRYAKMCIDACVEISADFARMFCESTFLFDGTPLAEAIQE